MVDKHTREPANDSRFGKRPAGWNADDEPMTSAQRASLRRLSEEANVPMDDTLTRDEAARRIEDLQAVTGRENDARPAGDRNVAQGHAPREHDRHTDASVLAGGHHVRTDAIDDDDETPLVRNRPVKRSSDSGDLS